MMERSWIFSYWMLEDGELYRHRPNQITDQMVPDLESLEVSSPKRI